MKRRKLVKNLSLVGSTAGVVAATAQTIKAQTSSGTTYPRLQWRMATSWPESLDIIFGGCKLIASRVSELTNGRFEITVFPAGGIAPPLEILDVVQSGLAECGHTAGYYYTSKNLAFGFTTVLPFGLNTYQQLTWMESGGGYELTRKLYADYNLINFLCCSTGNQMGGWFTKEVNTVEDLKNLKMRIPGIGGEVMKRLGAQVQNLPPSEIALALERKGIDAAEWRVPYEDEQLKLNEAAPFYYYPGCHEPGTTYDLIINLNAWERLPLLYKQTIRVATMEAHQMAIAQYDAVNSLALKRLISSGTKLVPFSQEILAAAQKAAFELYEEQANENPTFKEIYTQWKKFRDQIYQWNKINEFSFDQFVMNHE